MFILAWHRNWLVAFYLSVVWIFRPSDRITLGSFKVGRVPLLQLEGYLAW